MLRETPTRDEQFASTVKWLVRSVKSLQNGGATRGEVYLGPRIHIGDVVIEAQERGGGIALVAWNEATPDTTVTIVTV